MTALDFGDPQHYRRFLCLQFAARQPIERWLAGQMTDLPLPPPQAGLIEDDLAALGEGAPLPAAVPFDPPRNADPIGACWALAGSSLGNRAIQLAVHRASPHLPASFLADTAMTGYWQQLKPQLEASASDGILPGAKASARAVFASFLLAAARHVDQHADRVYR